MRELTRMLFWAKMRLYFFFKERHDLHKTDFLTRAGMHMERYHNLRDREEKERGSGSCLRDHVSDSGIVAK